MKYLASKKHITLTTFSHLVKGKADKNVSIRKGKHANRPKLDMISFGMNAENLLIVSVNSDLHKSSPYLNRSGAIPKAKEDW